MPILSILLYGSRARGDNSFTSDVDVLMVTNKGTIYHSNIGMLSMSFYPFDNLVERAERGDLFLCHVLSEGKLLYDSNSVVEILKAKFKLQDSYFVEKRQAADVAWLIVKYSNELGGSSLLGRRLAWCVRTILIASSAESGNPVFSTQELAQLAPGFNVLELIAQKERKSVSPFAINELKRFLEKQGLSDPLPNATEITDYEEQFASTKNTIGLSLLKVNREIEIEYV